MNRAAHHKWAPRVITLMQVVAVLTALTGLIVGIAAIPQPPPVHRCPRQYVNDFGEYTLLTFSVKQDGTEYGCHYQKHVTELARRGPR